MKKGFFFKLSVIVTLLATLAMVASIFLPYTIATEELAEELKTYSEEGVTENSEITASDMTDPSMFDYAKLFLSVETESSSDETIAVVCVIIVAAVGAFAVLAALFALLEKPVAVIIFSVLSFLVFLFQNACYAESGIITEGAYTWGIGYKLYHIAFAVAIVAAIWLLINKIIFKKKAKSIQV